jgi:hypothetical protein
LLLVCGPKISSIGGASSDLEFVSMTETPVAQIAMPRPLGREVIRPSYLPLMLYRPKGMNGIHH